jgi:hypothetical protein
VPRRPVLDRESGALDPRERCAATGDEGRDCEALAASESGDEWLPAIQEPAGSLDLERDQRADPLGRRGDR